MVGWKAERAVTEIGFCIQKPKHQRKERIPENRAEANAERSWEEKDKSKDVLWEV